MSYEKTIRAGEGTLVREQEYDYHWCYERGIITKAWLDVYEKTGDKRIFELVKRHTDALLRVRRADGGYGTVLDADESYTELSATGGIIAGINKAARLGTVDVQCDAGIILDNITPAGELSGVSTGTPVMPDKAAYMQIPTCPTLYGQALGILALM